MKLSDGAVLPGNQDFFPEDLTIDAALHLNQASHVTPLPSPHSVERDRILSVINKVDESQVLSNHLAALSSKVDRAAFDADRKPTQSLYMLHFISQDYVKAEQIIRILDEKIVALGINPLALGFNYVQLKDQHRDITDRLQGIFTILTGKEIALYDYYGGKKISKIQKVEFFAGSLIQVKTNDGFFNLMTMIEAMSPKQLARPKENNRQSIDHYVSATLDIPLNNIKLLEIKKGWDKTYLYQIQLAPGKIFTLELSWVKGKTLRTTDRNDFMKIIALSADDVKADKKFRLFRSQVFNRAAGQKLVEAMERTEWGTLTTLISRGVNRIPAPKKPSLWEQAKSKVGGWWQKLTA